MQNKNAKNVSMYIQILDRNHRMTGEIFQNFEGQTILDFFLTRFHITLKNFSGHHTNSSTIVALNFYFKR